MTEACYFPVYHLGRLVPVHPVLLLFWITVIVSINVATPTGRQ